MASINLLDLIAAIKDDHAPQKAIDWLERRAITHVPETIYTLDASQYLVMRTREDPSKPPEVSAREEPF